MVLVKSMRRVRPAFAIAGSYLEGKSGVWLRTIDGVTLRNERCPQGILRMGLAMNQMNLGELGRGGVYGVEPCGKLCTIRMCAVSVDDFHCCAQGNFFTKDLEHRRPFHDPSSKRML